MSLPIARKDDAFKAWHCRSGVAALFVTVIILAIASPLSRGNALVRFASQTLPSTDNASVIAPAQVRPGLTIGAPNSLLPPTFASFTSSGKINLRSAVFALGIQASPTFLAAWRLVFANLDPENRSSFALFLYYHGPESHGAAAASLISEWASEPDSVLVLASTPASRDFASDTWTTGRNALASAMYAYEVVRGRQFGWWGFADGDMFDLHCEGHRAPSDVRRAAACLALVVSAAMESPFALVATVAFGNYKGVAVNASTKTFLSPGPGYNVDGNINVRPAALDDRALPPRAHPLHPAPLSRCSSCTAARSLSCCHTMRTSTASPGGAPRPS